MQIAAGTDTGRVRTKNEDSHCAVDLRPDWSGHAVVVADGMGGYEAGEVASSLAVKAFVETVRSGIGGVNGDELESLIDAAIRQAHLDVVAEAESRGVDRMGSTLTAALIGSGHVYWGHIGDSRLYRIRDHVAEQISDDHSVVGELLRQGDLTESEAMVHPRRNFLTHALGTSGDMRIDTGSAAVAAGDVFVFCSDGLTNLVRGDEMAAIIAEAGIAAAPERLIALANERGGHDNITVVVVAK